MEYAFVDRPDRRRGADTGGGYSQALKLRRPSCCYIVLHGAGSGNGSGAATAFMASKDDSSGDDIRPPDNRYLRRPERHRKLEGERRLKEKTRRKQRRKYGAVAPSSRRIKFSPIYPPLELDFDINYDASVRFLDQLRRTSAAGGHMTFILMGRCNQLSPEVALVLAAEIERCLHHRPDSINGNDPQAPAAAAMLRDIGFHKLLNFNQTNSAASRPNDVTTYLKMKSGIQGGGQHADSLRELVLGDAAKTSDKLRDEMIAGLNEAMLNVHHHAYEDGIPNQFVPMPNKRWWIAGYRDAAKKEIGFIAFDQGVGIPATMPAKHGEFVADLFSTASQLMAGSSPTTDHLLIQRAFELGRTRTGRSGQGKGLNDFKIFLEAAGGKASLRVLSGRGSYLYNYDGTEKVEPLSSNFHGTLIVWRLTDSPAVSWEGTT